MIFERIFQTNIPFVLIRGFWNVLEISVLSNCLHGPPSLELVTQNAWHSPLYF